MDTKELGNLGDRIACEYLVKKGFKILGRNYKISFGEIDIIARKRWGLLDLFKKNPSANSGRAIHFVEVKTIIGSGSFNPEDRVDYKKQKKLRQLSEIWLKEKKLLEKHPYQIDVVGIIVSRDFKENKINYFENVVSDV